MSHLFAQHLTRRRFARVLPLLLAPFRLPRANTDADRADSTGSAPAQRGDSAAIHSDYNVMDPRYGAVGDGVTDDGPAFARAEAARQATGGRLVIPKPPVAYRVATQVTVDADNVQWQGIGWPEIRCVVPAALNFAATAGRVHLRLEGFTLANYHHAAFQPCLIVGGAGAGTSWEDVTLNLMVDGRDAVGEGVHLRQVYEGDVQLFSQHGPECLLRHNAERENSGNVRYRVVGNSVGAVVAFLNSGMPGVSNTLLNSIQFDVLKGVTGARTYYARTTANGPSAASQKVLTVASTAGMRAGEYVVIAGAQYAMIRTVTDATHLGMRDDLQVAVGNGDHVVASSFLCVAGPDTEQVQAIVPHSESTGVGFWACGARGIKAHGLLLGSGPHRAMLCTSGARQCTVLGVSFPNIAQLTLMECLDPTTLYNELFGWYNEEGGALAASILTDSTGAATNRAARSLYELSSTLSFDNDAIGLGYRNGDSTITTVLGTDGTHTHLRSRRTGRGVQVRIDDANGTNAAAIDSDTGTFHVKGVQVVGPRITGWSASRNGARAGIDASTATPAETAAALAQLLTDLARHGIIGQ